MSLGNIYKLSETKKIVDNTLNCKVQSAISDKTENSCLYPFIDSSNSSCTPSKEFDEFVEEVVIEDRSERDTEPSEIAISLSQTASTSTDTAKFTSKNDFVNYLNH